MVGGLSGKPFGAVVHRREPRTTNPLVRGSNPLGPTFVLTLLKLFFIVNQFFLDYALPLNSQNPESNPGDGGGRSRPCLVRGRNRGPDRFKMIRYRGGPRYRGPTEDRSRGRKSRPGDKIIDGIGDTY